MTYLYEAAGERLICRPCATDALGRARRKTPYQTRAFPPDEGGATDPYYIRVRLIMSNERNNQRVFSRVFPLILPNFFFSADFFAGSESSHYVRPKIIPLGAVFHSGFRSWHDALSGP